MWSESLFQPTPASLRAYPAVLHQLQTILTQEKKAPDQNYYAILSSKKSNMMTVLDAHPPNKLPIKIKETKTTIAETNFHDDTILDTLNELVDTLIQTKTNNSRIPHQVLPLWELNSWKPLSSTICIWKQLKVQFFPPWQQIDDAFTLLYRSAFPPYWFFLLQPQQVGHHSIPPTLF